MFLSHLHHRKDVSSSEDVSIILFANVETSTITRAPFATCRPGQVITPLSSQDAVDRILLPWLRLKADLHLTSTPSIHLYRQAFLSLVSSLSIEKEAALTRPSIGFRND